jgi:hypothetical protein
VPLFIIFFNFLIAEAIPLSHAAVMANSVAQFIINWNKKHPEANRPSVDYFAPLILLPAQLGGNNLGVLAGGVLPPDLLYVASICLLCAVTCKVFFKGWGVYCKEQAEAEALAAKSDENQAGLLEAVEQGSPGAHGKKARGKDSNLILTDDVELNEQAAAYLERRSIPDFWAVVIILSLWALFSVMYVVIKEEAACSVGYWAALGGLYPILIVFTVLGAWWVLKDQGELNGYR